ncbi:MAG: hydrogenase subunit MbhD domain-containing protein [Pseudomonadales bacterium]
MTAAVLFDLLLCVLIAGVALCAVTVRDLFAAIVFFIVYGVFVAIAWVRLDAIDVALTEAAIGAGLTGILLVGAGARFGAGPAMSTWAANTLLRRVEAVSRLALCLALGVALIAVVLGLPRLHGGLGATVDAHLAESGVSNPVTAVLLNFRSYDTLLEAMVLVVALVGVWSLTDDRFWGGIPGLRQHARPDGVLAYFGRLLPVVGLLVGVHLLWAGAHAPGGAFQSATVLAAVWLLVAMAGLTGVPAVSGWRVRLLLVAGPALFLLFGLASALVSVFLHYPPNLAYPIILVIELSLTVSIAITLSLLVLGIPRRQA